MKEYVYDYKTANATALQDPGSFTVKRNKHHAINKINRSHYIYFFNHLS